ncbi:MAG: helix-turn-helix domain-containing protein [Ruminococcus sp.]
MSKAFENTITYLRKEKGISQKQVAEDLGISQALLSHYEKGIRECSLDFVVKAAEYYGVSCDYILGASAQRNPGEIEESPQQQENKAMLENLNRRVIVNTVDFIFRILMEINEREITKASADMIMSVLYSVIRLLYKNSSDNDEDFFKKPSCSYASRNNSLFEDRRARLAESIEEYSKSRNKEKVDLSYSIITEKYSDLASSVLNLIHNTEKLMK